ncbi:Uncharacterized protein FWK35_00033759, partial [Aphis craccivora]
EANGSRLQNVKTRGRSIKNSIKNFKRSYTDYFKKCTPRLKRILTWIRKYIDFGIRCEHTVENHIQCASGGRLISRIGFHNSLWIKIPSFLRRHMSRKQNKIIVKFNPSAISNVK